MRTKSLLCRSFHSAAPRYFSAANEAVNQTNHRTSTVSQMDPTQLSQFHAQTFTSMLTSKFVYNRLDEVPQSFDVQLRIRKKKLLSTHYLYLYLLTGNKPYVKKYVTGKGKHQAGKKSTETKAHTSLSIEVNLEGGKALPTLQRLLFDVIPEQSINEQSAITVDQSKVVLHVVSATLTNETKKLKSANNYIDEFGFDVQFQFPVDSLYQRIWMLKSLRLLDDSDAVPNLDYDKEEEE